MAPRSVTARGVSKNKSTKKTSKKACYISEGTVDITRRLEDAILDILESRDPGKTCWPSEAPRRLFAGSKQDWRAQVGGTWSVDDALPFSTSGICLGGPSGRDSTVVDINGLIHLYWLEVARLYCRWRTQGWQPVGWLEKRRFKYFKKATS